MKIMPRNFLIPLIILFAFIWVGPASAQQSTPQPDDVNRVARQLYCPVCENTPLDVCPTQACSQWRDLIREKLAAGWTDTQIKQYFADQYGIRVLAEPASPLVYIIPPILFLVGIFIFIRALRALRRKPGVAAAQPTVPTINTDDDAYLSRVEAELKKRN